MGINKQKSKIIKYEGYSTLEVLEGADNYNKWIAEKIAPHLESRTLEIGAGIGNITQYLTEVSSLSVTDVDNELVKKLRNRFKKSKNVSTFLLDVTKAPESKVIDFFSTIFAVNVLEHIKDDQTALKNIRKMLMKDGKLVLLVPAKKRAYTRLDKSLGHYRRYEMSELTSLLESNGFLVKSISFFNFVGLLSWVTRDKIEKNNFHLKPYQIKLFDWAVPILKILEKLIPIPVGISLIVIAQKKKL